MACCPVNAVCAGAPLAIFDGHVAGEVISLTVDASDGCSIASIGADGSLLVHVDDVVAHHTYIAHRMVSG